ncbi:MAG: NusA-like transcription termination signal-binding factor [Candidatus Aenigmatarchaeota archaeon]
MTIKFDTETIRLMTLFENLTGVPVKDCLIDGNIIYFIVDEEKIGMAIGKNGSSVKNAEKVMNKTIKIFAYSSDLTKFVKNLIPKSNSVKINKENGKIVVEVSVEKSERPIIIGRDGKNLKILKELLKRSHDVSDLMIR